MKFSRSTLNLFLLTKLPSAFLAGVRVKSIDKNSVVVKVRHRWINQNPFRSLYWAVQGMASELATGILVMKEIQQYPAKVSMLVVHQKGDFLKKATGEILFSVEYTNEIKNALDESKATSEGKTIVIKVNGVDEDGDVVSSFEYHWSVKVK